MIAARRAIEEMSAAVCGYLRRDPERIPPQLIASLLVLERSIRAKLHIAEHNGALLSSASLEQLDGAEDPLSDHPRSVTLISDDDWEITVKSPMAAALIRYMAFSGAVSSCVNAADTMGRYLRVAYGIDDLPMRTASLKAICSRLLAPSALHTVLSESPGLEWMEKLRELRGECQHGKLAGSHYRDPGRSSEPLVPSRYCEDGNEVTMSAYLNWAIAKTDELITKSALLIAANPQHGVQLRRGH